MDEIIKSIQKHNMDKFNHVNMQTAIIKGNMTAGNIHNSQKRDVVVKKNISNLVDTEQVEYGDLDKSKKSYKDKIDEMNKRRDPEGLEKAVNVVLSAVSDNPIAEAYSILEKGKKLPIGTVTNGRKKVAEGKWVDVKKEGKKDSKDSSEGVEKQFKEFQAEYDKTPDDKKAQYISDLKNKIKKVETSGSYNVSGKYGRELYLGAKKFIKENEGKSTGSQEIKDAAKADIKDYVDSGMMIGDAMDKVIKVYEDAIKNPPKIDSKQYVAEYKEALAYVKSERKKLSSGDITKIDRNSGADKSATDSQLKKRLENISSAPSKLDPKSPEKMDALASEMLKRGMDVNISVNKYKIRHNDFVSKFQVTGPEGSTEEFKKISDAVNFAKKG